MPAFRVEDMTCGHCASAITRSVISLDAAAKVDIDMGQRLVSVDTSRTAGEVAAAILDAGYNAVPVGRGGDAAGVPRS